MASLYGNLETICDRRRSVREFKKKAVSADYIEKIKKIAHTSPYSSGRKNWELVTDPTNSNILYAGSDGGIYNQYCRDGKDHIDRVRDVLNTVIPVRVLQNFRVDFIAHLYHIRNNSVCSKII